MDLQFPSLLESAIAEKGSRKSFVQAMGYESISGGLNRLDQYLAGDRFPKHPDQFERLSVATGVPIEELRQIVREDRERVKEKEKEDRKERRKGDAYRLVIRVWKGYAVKRETLSADLTEDEAVDQALAILTETEVIHTPPLGYLYTPEGKKYVLVDGSVERAEE